MRMPRSGTDTGALGEQLSALKRRRFLRWQQIAHQRGDAVSDALPPPVYRRRRPPG